MTLEDMAHVEAEIIRLRKDDFGIPKHHHSALLRDSYGAPSLTQFSCLLLENDLRTITGISLANLVLLPSPNTVSCASTRQGLAQMGFPTLGHL